VDEVYKATLLGLPDLVHTLLSSGSIAIDQKSPEGWTLLGVAAYYGHSSVVNVLLGKGADPSKASAGDMIPLHESARKGHVDATKILAEACSTADLNATTKEGFTPLHLAAERGHWEVMKALIEAGANADSRTPIGESPLYTSALRGHVNAVRVLLRAKVNPLATRTEMLLGIRILPLDAAAGAGHLGVVRELIQQCGIGGCAGSSRGLHALNMASLEQRLEVAVFLVTAGVVDKGCHALMAAAGSACEKSIKILLQQRRRKSTRGEDTYINTRDDDGNTPLIKSILAPRFSSRVVRLFVDAGADTKSACKITSPNGEAFFDGTPLTLAKLFLAARDEEDAVEQRHRMEAIRRLLMRVEAVHAVSWLWHSDVPSISSAADDKKGTKTASVPMKLTLPDLRRRSRRPRAFSAALCR
ncbi:unnamed protein product, partial [Hapterophycus canaliculatus]